jgi:hypothetical protein
MCKYKLIYLVKDNFSQSKSTTKTHIVKMRYVLFTVWTLDLITRVCEEQ